MRVVIVDDDIQLSQLLKMGLQFGFYAKAKQLAREGKKVTEGLDVELFSERNEALKFLAKATKHVDLIFVEVHAGKSEGYQFMETCRDQLREKYSDLIMVTDRGNRGEIKRGILAGAKACVFKPFTPTELMEHVFNVWDERKV